MTLHQNAILQVDQLVHLHSVLRGMSDCKFLSGLPLLWALKSLHCAYTPLLVALHFLLQEDVSSVLSAVMHPLLLSCYFLCPLDLRVKASLQLAHLLPHVPCLGHSECTPLHRFLQDVVHGSPELPSHLDLHWLDRELVPEVVVLST